MFVLKKSPLCRAGLFFVFTSPLCRAGIFLTESPFVPIMAARIRPSLDDSSLLRHVTVSIESLSEIQMSKTMAASTNGSEIRRALMTWRWRLTTITSTRRRDSTTVIFCWSGRIRLDSSGVLRRRGWWWRR